MLTPEDILRHLKGALPDFETIGVPERLQGGLVNYVWRVNGRLQSIIVKIAPPFVATAPDIRLDPRRIIIEGHMLAAFAPGGLLAGIGGTNIRPPRLIDLNEERGILVIEDIGDNLDFGTWLFQGQQQETSASEIGRTVGTFIGTLHAQSYNDQNLAQAFDNMSIQQVRLESHYRRITEYCIRGGLADAEELGQEAVAFGQLLQQPGLCVIMGDLWPRSLLITAKGVLIIDWEFAHFGRPAQDVGHLTAHLWMHTHCAPNEDSAIQAQAALHGFLENYRLALGSTFETLFGATGERECAIHFGAEVLARTVGTFQNGYLYGGLPPNEAKIQEAAAVAAAHLRASENVDTFAMLKVS